MAGGDMAAGRQKEIENEEPAPRLLGALADDDALPADGVVDYATLGHGSVTLGDLASRIRHCGPAHPRS